MVQRCECACRIKVINAGPANRAVSGEDLSGGR